MAESPPDSAFKQFVSQINKNMKDYFFQIKSVKSGVRRTARTKPTVKTGSFRRHISCPQSVWWWVSDLN